MNTFTDYYELLGVDSAASPGVIKAAFKKLALQYHPDVYKGEDANERMAHILQAYQTLNDPVARKQYDLRRSEHLLDGHSSSMSSKRTYSAPSSTMRTPGHKAAQTEVSPGARRDRQRHYAFPVLQSGKPLRVDLGDSEYTLAPHEAQQLVQDGLLRGVAPEAKQQYFCHRCHHHWNQDRNVQGKRQPLPRFCPKCHATDWPEYLLLRCLHCTAIFESEQIRYEIGAYSYGQDKTPDQGGLCPPYELFPLCPYCGMAHWSPSEEIRVDDLRQKAARKALFVRFLGIGMVVLIVVLIALVALGGR
ncbi:hypothetical protein KDW_11540 [Dictyobacter vulcani]|uniref:J domain-containing protein n=1 Tax=Dictyobacter vulcani TaxID=2607529 RepID=A0A5J4KJ67_9CHLR|nr:DnaJ domain-containing protein [Dictyobacter vulcani]GER86992.1 hypothetical protein KDW_11540 [Dictyobacter vulcani]